MSSRVEVKNELLRIHEENEKLTPQLVVSEAEPEESPLHNCFEWDDQKAGHNYRLWQARILIKSIVIEFQGDDPAKRQNLFFHTVRNGEPEYQTREILMNEPNLLSAAITLAAEKLRGANQSLDQLKKIAESKGTKRQAARYRRASRHVERAITLTN